MQFEYARTVTEGITVPMPNGPNWVLDKYAPIVSPANGFVMHSYIWRRKKVYQELLTGPQPEAPPLAISLDGPIEFSLTTKRDEASGSLEGRGNLMLSVTSSYPLAVAQFAEQMAKKLRENGHKGDWTEVIVPILMDRLEEELTEFKEAIAEGQHITDVIKEAADVANFLMFICNRIDKVERKPS